MTNRTAPAGLLLGGRELVRLVAGVTIGFVLLLAGITVAFGTPADATTPRPCSTHDKQQQGERGGRPCTPCPTVTPTITQPAAGPLTRTRPRPSCSPSPTSTPTSTPPTTSPTTSPSASTSPSPSRTITASPSPTVTTTPARPADDDDDDTLPLTGPGGMILTGIAVTALVGGAVLLYMARRRRTRYVA